jgi:hypothetical protein
MKLVRFLAKGLIIVTSPLWLLLLAAALAMASRPDDPLQ